MKKACAVLFVLVALAAFQSVKTRVPNTCDNMDVSCLTLDEEFMPGGTASLAVGTYGWGIKALGAAGTISHIAGVSPNLGITRVPSTGTSGQGTILALDSNSVGPLGNLSTGPVWDSYWIFRPNTLTVEQMRVGYIPANTTTAVPASGLFIRFDTQAKNIASAACNDAGNKCGLTTLTCATSDTVLFSINGGTATGSVACTGTNAIADTTAITVTAAGGGYNTVGGAAVGTVTGGTSAVHTGAIALTPTLGAAASGGDSNFMACVGVASLESCTDTGIAADAVFHRARFRQAASGKIGMTFYDAAGAVELAEKIFGPSAADVIVTPATTAMSPGVIVVTFDAGVAKTLDLDKWTFKAQGLAR